MKTENQIFDDTFAQVIENDHGDHSDHVDTGIYCVRSNSIVSDNEVDLKNMDLSNSKILNSIFQEIGVTRISSDDDHTDYTDHSDYGDYGD